MSAVAFGGFPKSSELASVNSKAVEGRAARQLAASLDPLDARVRRILSTPVLKPAASRFQPVLQSESPPDSVTPARLAAPTPANTPANPAAQMVSSISQSQVSLLSIGTADWGECL